MPGQQAWVAKGLAATSSIPLDIMERASPDVITTITADPTTGTALAVTARDRFPQAANFKVRVDNEVMLVTAGFGTGAGTFTVARGQDGTSNVAHTVGVTCALVVGVQRIDPVDASKQVSFKGRASTWRTPGRNSLTGQKLFAIFNESGSTVIVDVHNVQVDLIQTAVKAITTLPPMVRVYKFGAIPTNGTVLVKNPEDAALTPKSTVKCYGDASADGTSSVTTLTIGAIAPGTQTGLLDQLFAPRLFTAVGYEPIDVVKYFEGEDEVISLRASEGLAVFADHVAGSQNPLGDMWLVSARFIEYAFA